jgi:NAD(P)-dependent dehydrogenase (short-subunit alcohol dehydrogenase family)
VVSMDTWFEAGHVAIVTGGSRGLGKALARELLLRGVHTIVDGRDPRVLQATCTELREFGELVAIAGDVADERHVRALFDAARKFGRLDLLVNNASTLGAVPLPSVRELSRGVLERLFAVNLFAPIALMRAAVALMRDGGGLGTIVNVTSDAGVEAYAGWAGYGATKAALEHVSRVLAEELEGSGIRVLVADPGDMDTQMHRDAIPDADPAQLRHPADSARALLLAIASMQQRFERIRLAALVGA